LINGFGTLWGARCKIFVFTILIDSKPISGVYFLYIP
jgi:hypothetical protein